MRYDLIYVVAGAAVGASLRYLIAGKGLYWGGLPVSVLVVNVLGSLTLGVSMAAVQRMGIGSEVVLFVGIGFCGSFTTLSTLAFESANLLDGGMLWLAIADMGLNMGLSLSAIFLGRALILLLMGGV